MPVFRSLVKVMLGVPTAPSGCTSAPVMVSPALSTLLDAAPVNAAVMVPAVKFPEPSRATMALAVLALAAVVAELLTLPAVTIVASLVSTMAAEAFISALTIVSLAIIVLETVPLSPVVITVPVTFGSVMVWSAVASAPMRRISFASSVVPSNCKPMFAPSVMSPVTVPPALGSASAARS